jgi:hypothetical protein
VIAEAVDTVWTLGWALLVWIVLLAATATLALWTVFVTVAWACRGLWRCVVAVRSSVQRSAVPESPHASPVAPQAPQRPSWAQPDKEAA